MVSVLQVRDSVSDMSKDHRRGLTFGGQTVRSTAKTGRGNREFFQWFDTSASAEAGTPIGDIAIDSYSFEAAPKLGPCIIYLRELPVASAAEAQRYFDGNVALRADSENRARISNDTGIVWASEQEYIDGFHEMYGDLYSGTDFDPQTNPWDASAERGHKWYCVRAVAQRDGEYVEVLSWVVESPRTSDELILLGVGDHLIASGFEPLPGQMEIFDTHVRRPNSGMIVFEIAHNVSKGH